ncbi:MULTISPECIES: DUF4401 domain-containing protein [unclassified Psychrobacter]|uniref:DUF4401 domain-containing protein n=1 Tax=unclassified Psychrobacter TaxID=196806 RepID=UPI000ED01CC9|nr:MULTISPECIES: DUF4401 domain-containing protein [unclassified Psychrobacter]MBE8609874.1 DUF4401 domain-containing protein [Pseudomonas lundensis]HCI76124.1 hypothetical protein [Psychrobacter sp.]
MSNDMNNQHSDNVLLQLQQLGLIDGNAVDARTGETSAKATIANNHSQNDTPWFIQILFGLSGIVASLFLIAFLSLLLFGIDGFDSVIALLITGLVLSAAGFVLFRNKQSRDNTFISSLALAISSAGQAYIGFALFDNNLSHPIDIWLFLIVQAVMTVIMPNRIYRLLGSIMTLGLTVYLLNYYHLPELSLGLLALITIGSNLSCNSLLQRIPNKWRADVFDITKPIGYASALMLLCVSVYFIAAERSHSLATYYGDTFSYNYYLAQGLLTLASLYAAYLILQRYEVKPFSSASIMVYCAVIVLGILSIYVSGLIATSLIIVIAIANSQRVLLGLGVTALVSYVFWYYYQLDTSLLIKSLSMLIVGLTMLMGRWILIKRYFANSLINDTDLTMSANDHQERHS